MSNANMKEGSVNQTPPSSNSRPRRRRRPRPGGAAGEHKTQNARPNEAAPSGASRSSNSRRKRRRSGGSKLSAMDRLIVKVENLRHANQEARRKYFELFDRADPRQKEKLERQFSQSAKVLRDFENSLNEQEKQLFKQHYDAYPMDLTYAQNHELDPKENPPSFEARYDDPHELESQKQANFKDDTEESIGSYEDYKSYKGLD
jgi:hypothetical protein